LTSIRLTQVTSELVLFLLRILSGALLLSLLAVLMMALWREYRSVSAGVEARRRSYGYLAVLREIDGRYVLTGENYPLLPLTSLGRSPTNTIPINDTFASGEHALVVMRDGQWWLEDRHSRNGTLLNDMPVNGPTVVTQGDIIGIGKMKFRVELEK
jgi:hypothetical protein